MAIITLRADGTAAPLTTTATVAAAGTSDIVIANETKVGVEITLSGAVAAGAAAVAFRESASTAETHRAERFTNTVLHLEGGEIVDITLVNNHTAAQGLTLTARTAHGTAFPVDTVNLSNNRISVTTRAAVNLAANF